MINSMLMSKTSCFITSVLISLLKMAWPVKPASDSTTADQWMIEGHRGLSSVLIYVFIYLLMLVVSVVY